MWPRPSDTGQVLEPKAQRLGRARSTCSEPCCSHFPFVSWQPARLTPATHRPVEPPPIIASGCAPVVLSICPLSECGASAPWRPSCPTTALCRRTTPRPHAHPCPASPPLPCEPTLGWIGAPPRHHTPLDIFLTAPCQLPRSLLGDSLSGGVSLPGKGLPCEPWPISSVCIQRNAPSRAGRC